MGPCKERRVAPVPGQAGRLAASGRGGAHSKPRQLGIDHRTAFTHSQANKLVTYDRVEKKDAQRYAQLSTRQGAARARRRPFIRINLSLCDVLTLSYC